MKGLITRNHVSLPCSWLYTLILIFPDATPTGDPWLKPRTLGAQQYLA